MEAESIRQARSQSGSYGELSFTFSVQDQDFVRRKYWEYPAPKIWAPRFRKARELPNDQFKHEVEKELTGQDTEATEIIYFKFYKSQIPIIARMLGTDE
ncbi:MAG TPA: hypothetical protein VK788_18920 [Terriglobales bacterium]|jgi:hypothetical protein|nr:hypothetical protein [Terriglobales bacterium]